VPDGEPRTKVVFIPGFMQPGDAWKPVADRLGERYSSVLFDHGEHTYEGRLAEIAAAGEGAVLVGYSLGGRLALHAALREPSRYDALVTVGASAGIEDSAERIARREADEKLASWMKLASIGDIVTVWERQPLFADQSEALITLQRPGRLDQDPAGLASLLRTAGQGTLEPVWRELHRLTLPILAIAGARDERYSGAAQRMAEAVPDGRAATVPDAGHAPQLQQPEAVANLIAGFLDAPEGS
jgi:2-succinyl-6-hydroxy-2,4-cyclohexadiene-1-carboxylate synthase